MPHAALRVSAGGGAFDPLTLSPYLWHEPAYLASQFEDDSATDAAEVADGIAVSQDRSGNSRHGSQTSATLRPTLGNSSALYWHDYDGSNDYLTLASSLGLLRNRAGFTCVAGVRLSTTGANVKTMISVPSGAGNGRFGLQTDSGGGTTIDAAFRRLDADSATLITRSFTNNTDYVVTVHCDYAGTGQVSLALNRGTPATATLPSAAGNSSDTNSSAVPSMGGFGSSSTNPMRGRIYAMFVCPLLSGGDTANLEAYVATLSGVTL